MARIVRSIGLTKGSGPARLRGVVRGPVAAQEAVKTMFGRFVSMIAPMACPACQEGSGTIAHGDDRYEICPVCHGTGLDESETERLPLLRHLSIRRHPR